MRSCMGIHLGQVVSKAACLALGIFTIICLKHVFIESSNDNPRQSQSNVGQPTSVVCDFLLLFTCLAAGMTWLKTSLLPGVIASSQFPKSWGNDKYYGFAALASYHSSLVFGFLALLVFHGRSAGSVYRMLTLMEPAYSTFDVLLFMITGSSFTNWQIKPLLVHHVISCACTHALLYGTPCSVYGICLQLFLHMSSAVCLGIANAAATPSFNVKLVHNVTLQVLALLVWGLARVFLLLVLVVSLILDAQQDRRLVKIELAVAAAASMLYVVIKTPILLHGIRTAVQEYEPESLPESLGMSVHVETRPQEACAEVDLQFECDDGVERLGVGDLVAETQLDGALAQRRRCSVDCSEISLSDDETDLLSTSDDSQPNNFSSRESSYADLVSLCNAEHN